MSSNDNHDELTEFGMQRAALRRAALRRAALRRDAAFRSGVPEISNE
jgi:hypothetical protein